MLFFLIFGVLYGKISTFSIFKKPFHGQNRATPQNNSSVHLPDSVLQHWKPLKPTTVVKNDILSFFSVIDGRPSLE